VSGRPGRGPRIRSPAAGRPGVAGLPEGVRELDHTADVGVEITAPDAATLFDRAARALRSLAVPGVAGSARPADAEEAHTHTLELAAADVAALLVRWLSELLYRIDALGLAYDSADIEIEQATVRARLRETRLPEPGAHIKAVTYHGLACGPRPDGSWRARVIFDV